MMVVEGSATVPVVKFKTGEQIEKWTVQNEEWTLMDSDRYRKKKNGKKKKNG